MKIKVQIKVKPAPEIAPKVIRIFIIRYKN